MALTNIEYGSIASSQLLNDNFNYLEDKIEDYSKNISNDKASLTALINSQVLTLTNSLNNAVETLNNTINSNVETLNLFTILSKSDSINPITAPSL